MAEIDELQPRQLVSTGCLPAMHLRRELKDAKDKKERAAQDPSFVAESSWHHTSLLCPC